MHLYRSVSRGSPAVTFASHNIGFCVIRLIFMLVTVGRLLTRSGLIVCHLYAVAAAPIHAAVAVLTDLSVYLCSV